ncbi:zinc finger CCCH-type with G patch domain-containing protein-like isoform X1 [Haliotis asinina]|uniref:zinc finger CCCH-type with G patch domain-containing protein-like isoform X1 n=1 Tax=Haliotis asinina TaxID=109174 RepID=UPI00353274D0
MDEEGLEQSLEMYRTQLSQVSQAVQAAGATDDLIKLQEDLTELINLTQESLLSLKKSKLLASLESSATTPPAPPASSATSAATTIDDEYSAFQAALGGDVFDAPPVGTSSVSPPPTGNQSELQLKESGQSDDEEEADASVAESFSELVGMKCRAPFSHDWGGLAYHNALVFQVEPSITDDEIPKVSVMFCNPTHISMVPCRFFLDGRCRFSEEKCKYSHGHVVNIKDLQAYQDPDYSHVQVGGKCFARYSDDVWHPASIDDVADGEVTVTFTSHGNSETVELQDILPQEQHVDDSLLSDDEKEEEPSTSSQTISREDSDSEDELPVFLWKPPKTTAALGEWEQYTKGIGSKLMAKMGYITGQGLGVRGEGRAEPVPIQLLPQGKSLDKIMELKEIAGDQDLFDALKKLKRKKRKEERKAASSNPVVRDTPPNVFDFINKKLRGKKGNLSELVSHHASGSKSKTSHHIPESELRKKSDKHLNIQAFQTYEEIRKVEKELTRLHASLTRNQDRDKRVADQVRQKISSAEAYLANLKSSQVTLEKHKQSRSDSKKLMVF